MTTFPTMVRSPLTVWFHETLSPAKVGLLAVVSHQLKLTALAVAAVVAVRAFHEILILAVPAEILAAVRAVRADPSPRNAVAFTVPATSSLYPGFATPIPIFPAHAPVASRP